MNPPSAVSSEQHLCPPDDKHCQVLKPDNCGILVLTCDGAVLRCVSQGAKKFIFNTLSLEACWDVRGWYHCQQARCIRTNFNHVPQAETVSSPNVKGSAVEVKFKQQGNLTISRPERAKILSADVHRLMMLATSAFAMACWTFITALHQGFGLDATTDVFVLK